MRKWIIAIAALLTVPMVGAAAVVYTPAVEEQLVEGHTVFTVIQVRNASATAREEFAAAVAVLVRENRYAENYQNRFPGVLWFNDQYLVNPEQAAVKQEAANPRYPCGAVIATNRGDALPMDANGRWVVPANASYQESYRITDPNEKMWDVDVWNYDPDGPLLAGASFKIWSVAVGTVFNSQSFYTVPDNGTADCQAQTDRPCGGLKVLPFVDDTPQRPAGYPTGSPWLFDRAPVYHDEGGLARNNPGGNKSEPGPLDGEGRLHCGGANFKSPGDNGLGYPCGLNCTGTGTPLLYNAVLFFFLKDLTVNGTAKNHTEGSTDWQNDASGCHPTTTDSYPPSYAPPSYAVAAWPCENDDDSREGNSHPYNPDLAWPLQTSEGRGNHGGSTGCGNNNGGFYGGGAYEMHATCQIDIYFGYKEGLVPPRSYPTVFDNEGGTAPYHCHDTMAVCNEEEHSATASWA